MSIPLRNWTGDAFAHILGNIGTGEIALMAELGTGYATRIF